MKPSLEEQITQLQTENQRLRDELFFLRSFPTLIQGLRGEALVRQITGGEAGTYQSKYDVRLPNGLDIEVKFSKLNEVGPGITTRRWNWSNPLGLSKGRQKQYSHLILVGEKDARFRDRIEDGSPYVFFLIPFSAVPEICRGTAINLSSNFDGVRSIESRRLLDFLCDVGRIRDLLALGTPVATQPFFQAARSIIARSVSAP